VFAIDLAPTVYSYLVRVWRLPIALLMVDGEQWKSTETDSGLLRDLHRRSQVSVIQVPPPFAWTAAEIARTLTRRIVGHRRHPRIRSILHPPPLPSEPDSCSEVSRRLSELTSCRKTRPTGRNRSTYQFRSLASHLPAPLLFCRPRPSHIL